MNAKQIVIEPCSNYMALSLKEKIYYMKKSYKENVKGFVRRNPFIVMLVMSLIFEIILQFDIGETIWGQIPNRLVFSIIVFGVLYVILGKNLLCFKVSDCAFALISYGYFVFYAIVSEIVRVTQLNYKISFTIDSLINILACLILSIIVGFIEEGVYRGIVLNGFIQLFPKTQKGLYLSVVLNGLFFGISHVWYSFSEMAMNPGSVIIQIVGTTLSIGGVGILFASIYLRTKNIWACIFVHALGDFLSFLFDILNNNQLSVQYADFNVEISNAWLSISFIGSTLIKTIPYLIISFFILKKVEPTQSVLWRIEDDNA